MLHHTGVCSGPVGPLRPDLTVRELDPPVHLQELRKTGENAKVTTQLRAGWVWGGRAERVGVKGAHTTGSGYARLAFARRMR